MPFLVRVWHSRRNPRALDVYHSVNAFTVGGRAALEEIGSSEQHRLLKLNYGTVTAEIDARVAGGTLRAAAKSTGLLTVSGPVISIWVNDAGINILPNTPVVISRAFVQAARAAGHVVTES